MPILEIEIVGIEEIEENSVAQPLADAAAEVLNTGAGRTWVKVRYLNANLYAESGGTSPDIKPVFVSVLIGRSLGGEEKAQVALALASAIGKVLNRPSQNVHILFEPDGVGRIAFGGQLKTE